MKILFSVLAASVVLAAAFLAYGNQQAQAELELLVGGPNDRSSYRVRADLRSFQEQVIPVDDRYHFEFQYKPGFTPSLEAKLIDSSGTKPKVVHRSKRTMIGFPKVKYVVCGNGRIHYSAPAKDGFEPCAV